MTEFVPVFQIEVRFNHFLNFSTLGKDIMSPFVKLSQKFQIENQNTFNERINLHFEDDNYLIVASWDRILLKGQGSLELYTHNNSPIDTPFLQILDSFSKCKEFDSIKNILFNAYYVKKIEEERESIIERFVEKFITDSAVSILNNSTDVAVSLEKKSSKEERFAVFGPYLGISDLEKRQMVPFKINNLGDINFNGVMLDFKYFKQQNTFDKKDFLKFVDEGKKVKNQLWKSI